MEEREVAITYHRDLVQGSDEWHQARCGLLTASEVKLILSIRGGGLVTQYRASGVTPEKPTAKKTQALDAIGDRAGSVAELCFLADVSDGVIRGLIKDGAIEKFEARQPRCFSVPNDAKERAHLWELAAQRISGYVEPSYIGEDMLRGHEDEITARNLYRKNYEKVEDCGFVTNDKWGFTLGCSPDGLVGAEGIIEAKSRRQKFQVETICTYYAEGTIPEDFVLQVQAELLVTGRKWCDLISFSGGLPMVTMRVWPDDKVQDAIIEAAAKFEARINEVVADYQAALEAEPRLIPTERRIEQEMFV